MTSVGSAPVPAGAADAATIGFELDGRPVDARPGETIFEAARRHGTTIPALCRQEGYRPDGNCRACVVEIDGERVLAASCCRMPAAGMKVRSASARARAAQRMVVELLLADAPAEPRRADSELAQWAQALGVATSRFAPRAQPLPDFSHPAIAVQLDACIQCTRCVRACREEQANDVIGFAGRGDAARIVFDFGDPMGASTCVGCGECVQACPTGALMPRLLGRMDAPGSGTDAPRATDVVSRPGEATLPPGEAALRPGEATVRAGEPPLRAGDVAPRTAGRRVDSLCPFCGVGCQLTYHVTDNRIIRVEGRNGPANHGRLCVKGRFGFDYVASGDRLTVPLVRRGNAPKNPVFGRVPADWRDQFREATWEEAIEIAAGGFVRIRDTIGPQALAGFGSAKGSNEEAYLFQKLVRTGFRTNNVDHCTRLCHASSVAALLEGIGSGAVSNPVSDVAKADFVLVIGSNPTVNHPVAATWIKNAARRGTTLVVADPKRNDLARHADVVLQFAPGADVALLNAMLHAIVEGGFVDREFVAARTEAFEALREHVARFPPERMAPLCGIDAATIREVAQRYATSRASMILWGMGVSQHVHGTDNARCLIALALVTGQIGRPGAGLHPLRGQNNVQGASDVGLIPMMLPDYGRVDDERVATKYEKLWGAALDRRPGLTVVEILKAARAHSVRGLYVMGENPAMSDPDANHARAALASLDLLVVQDIFPTETAYLADVVLPASAFPEKTGSFTNTDRMVQLGRKAIEPPGQARADLDILVSMARRLGLDWTYSQPREVFEELRQAMDSIGGIDWDRLVRAGSVTYPCTDADDPGQPVVFRERFPTASGRGRLVPAAPGEPAERPDADYPFVLTTGRQLEHWHTGAMTRRAQALDAIEPVPTASMHSSDLRRLGVAGGERVSIASRRGRIVLYAREDDGVAIGSVFVPFAYAEAAANALTHPQLDPFGKIPGFKYCAVRIERASADAQS